MQLAKVIGNVVATRKDEQLIGHKLLLIQPITPDRVATGLLVAASTEDGMVEALERPDRRWAISVQWHPERDEMATEQKPLFAAFVNACNQIRL